MLAGSLKPLIAPGCVVSGWQQRGREHEPDYRDNASGGLPVRRVLDVFDGLGLARFLAVCGPVVQQQRRSAEGAAMKKAEREHRNKVAALGCIVCINNGFMDSPAQLHHIRKGQGMSQRAGEYEVIPLCPWHHQQGGYGFAIHAGQQLWEEKYGTECQLLAQTLELLGISA